MTDALLVTRVVDCAKASNVGILVSWVTRVAKTIDPSRDVVTRWYEPLETKAETVQQRKSRIDLIASEATRRLKEWLRIWIASLDEALPVGSRSLIVWILDTKQSEESVSALEQLIDTSRQASHGGALLCRSQAGGTIQCVDEVVVSWVKKQLSRSGADGRLSPGDDSRLRAIADDAVWDLMTEAVRKRDVPSVLAISARLFQLQDKVLACGLDYVSAFAKLKAAKPETGAKVITATLHAYLTQTRELLLEKPEEQGKGHFGTIAANRAFVVSLKEALTDIATTLAGENGVLARLEVREVEPGQADGEMLWTVNTGKPETSVTTPLAWPDLKIVQASHEQLQLLHLTCDVVACGLDYERAFTRLKAAAQLEVGDKVIKEVFQLYLTEVRRLLLEKPEGKGHFGSLEANKSFAEALTAALQGAGLRLKVPGRGVSNYVSVTVVQRGPATGYFQATVDRKSRSLSTKGQKEPCPGCLPEIFLE